MLKERNGKGHRWFLGRRSRSARKARREKLDKNPQGYENARDKADDGNTAQGGGKRPPMGYEERIDKV